MVTTISIWPTMGGACKADVSTGEMTSWLSIRTHNGNDITIYCLAEHADKFRMMADIFNDAFAPPQLAAQPASIDPDFVDDLPF